MASDFENFAKEVVLRLLKLPATYLEPNTGHNLSVVLCHIQTLAALDVDVSRVKLLGETKKQEVAALAIRGADSMNSLMVGEHARNFMTKGNEDPRDFDLAPGRTPGTVSLVLRGGPGALDAPRDLIAAALGIAYADNASSTSKSLIDKKTEPGKKVTGTVKEVVKTGGAWGNDFVEHVFEAGKIWWTKDSRFEKFAYLCCKAFKFGAPSPSNLDKTISKIKLMMRGDDLSKTISRSKKHVESASKALTEALVASGLIAIADTVRSSGTLNPYDDEEDE